MEKLNENAFGNKIKRAYYRKLKLVKLRGGGCELCGYNKNLSALEYHHRDPKDKTFMINSNTLGGLTYQECVEESEKCDLLCSNCHREHHNPQSDISLLEASLGDYIPNDVVDSTKCCITCNKPLSERLSNFVNNSKYCSSKCFARQNRKSKIDSIGIESILLRLKTETKSAIADELGMSRPAFGRTLVKRLKLNDINELNELIKSK